MTLIEMLMFIFIMSAGHFLGRVIASKAGVGGWFAGCFLGIVISLVILHLISVLFRRLQRKGCDTDKVPIGTSILPFWNGKVANLKGASIEKLNTLPVDSKETVVWYDLPVQIQTHCEKLDDKKFQLTLSAKFQEEGDTIIYTRDFIAPNQQEQQT